MPAHPEHAPALGAAALAAAALRLDRPAAAATDAAAPAPAAASEAGARSSAPPPPPERVCLPRLDLAATYDHAYASFCRLHPALRPTFAALAAPPPPTAAAAAAPPRDPRLEPQSSMEWAEAAQ